MYRLMHRLRMCCLLAASLTLLLHRRNLSLLSFGDEEAAEEQALTRGGIKAKIVSR